MTLLTIPERVQLLKNLLDDPFDWVSKEILRLADEHDRLQGLDVDDDLPTKSSQKTTSAK